MDPQGLLTAIGPQLFTALPHPVFVLSPEGVFLHVNPAAARYFRRPPEEVVGRSVVELFPADQVARQLEVLRTVLETGRPFAEELPTAFGEDRYVFRYTVEAIRGADGDAVGVLGMVHDVTAFVSLERKYAALYEGATDSLFAIDSQGGIRALNRQAEVMSGYSREELERLKIWDVIDPGEVVRLQGYLQARADGRDAPTRYENRWTHASGDSRWAEVHISREPIEPGVFQASVRDITERRRLEELRQDFVHMISHDVKAPLTVIQGFCQALLSGKHGKSSPRQAEHLAQIYDAGKRIERMMEQFLAAERLDAAEPWEPSPARAAALVRGVLRSFQEEAEGRSITLAEHLDVPANLAVADAEAAHRILDNLVSNALKFTPADGRVSVHLTVSGGGLEIEVEDTGVGIPAAEQGGVFQRFFRASTAGGQRGSGLGLYITRRLAERSGGRISVASRPGGGTRFKAWLPASLARAGSGTIGG